MRVKKLISRRTSRLCVKLSSCNGSFGKVRASATFQSVAFALPVQSSAVESGKILKGLESSRNISQGSLKIPEESPTNPRLS